MIHLPHHGRLRRREHVEAVRSPIPRQPSGFATLEHALEAVSIGRPIVVVDDHDRETADWDGELGPPETRLVMPVRRPGSQRAGTFNRARHA